MKIGLKWALPGDITGGLMLFGIMFTIAIIELYILKASQASAIFPPAGGAGGGGHNIMSAGSLVGGIKKIEDKCKKAYPKDEKKRQKCKDDAILGKGGGGISLLSHQKRLELTQAQQ